MFIRGVTVSLSFQLLSRQFATRGKKSLPGHKSAQRPATKKKEEDEHSID
jgi:hypothetical protein